MPDSIQDELFSPEDLPEDEQAVRAVKQYTVTGKIAFKDQDRLQSICSDLLAGQGVKTIARRYSMGAHTIRRIRDELEAGGKLTPFKQRSLYRLRHLHESCVEELQDRLDESDSKVPDSVLGIAIGITSDKISAAEDRAMGLVSGDAETKGDRKADLLERISKARRVQVVDAEIVNREETQ